ncbi:MAG: hypothetical protein U0V73_13020 [Acidimicrobiia bacterium]
MPEDGPAADEHARVAKWKIALGMSGILLLAVGAVLVGVSLGGGRSSKVFRYVVPEGTATRTSNGEKVILFPARLTVHVGDKLIVRNDDVRQQHVGPFFIKPASTLRLTFSTAGTITGSCTLSPEGAVTITVLPD